MGVGVSTVIPGISILTETKPERWSGVGFGPVPLQNFSGFQRIRFVKFKEAEDGQRWERVTSVTVPLSRLESA